MDRNRYLPVVQNHAYVNPRPRNFGRRNISNRKTSAEIILQIGNSILQTAFIAILISLLILFSIKLAGGGVKFEKSGNQSAEIIGPEICKMFWELPRNRHICRHPDKIEIINID